MICLDATSLAYALRDSVRRPEEKAVCDLVRSFLAHPEVSPLGILIPTPVLSEHLTMFADAEAEDEFAELARRGFFLAPFDFPAARLAASLRRKAGGRSFEAELRERHHVSKQNVKVDFQIVAIAAVRRATRIITADEGIIRIAAIAGLAATRLTELQLPAASLGAESGPNLFSGASEGTEGDDVLDEGE